MKKGLFIVFEGGEGGGKSTQAKLLADYLEKSGQSVALTKEPGSADPVCKDIRGVLLNPDYKGKMSAFTEFLLFEADRSQHVEKVIQPALSAGKVVISDRFDGGTYAYQCGVRGVPTEHFDAVNGRATGGLRPDFAFLFDIDPKVGLSRNKKDGKHDRFEMENMRFHGKVRESYLEFFAKYYQPNQWKKIDASKAIEETQKEILSALEPLLKVS